MSKSQPIMRRIWSVIRRQKEPLVNGLRGPREIREVIVAERLRSNRSGQPLTLALIDIGHGENHLLNPGFFARLLATVVVERTRSTDTKGWYEGRLAILMPYTEREDVCSVLESIEAIYVERATEAATDSRAVPSLKFEVYSHPNPVSRKPSLASLKRGVHRARREQPLDAIGSWSYETALSAQSSKRNNS